jgi:hypothetical protein
MHQFNKQNYITKTEKGLQDEFSMEAMMKRLDEAKL